MAVLAVSDTHSFCLSLRNLEGPMNRIQEAKYGEWLASILGACLVAGAIGAMLPKQSNFLVASVLTAGSLLHLWGMIRIHIRNQELKRNIP